MSIYSNISKDSEAEKHIDLHVKSNDRTGLLTEIFSVFSEMEINKSARFLDYGETGRFVFI